MRTRAQGADGMALDVPFLATTLDLAESEIQTLLDSPTPDLIRDFLTTLTVKAQEWDSLKAEKLKVDVELENTVRTSESKLKAQKAVVTKHTKEINELRTKLNEAESAHETLSTELASLQSSTSGSTAETEALRQRIETLEASNRDALALVESKSAEKDRVAIELSEQHSKLLALRREVGQLEESNQSLQNAASSQKFKEQSLQQEIDLLKRNNEWHANELQTRNGEYAKFRKERNARITNLQRELEESTSNVESLTRTEGSLRQRLEEVQGKADEAFARIATLQEEAARKEQGWKTELDGSKRLGELQAQNAATHKSRLQDVEAQMEQVRTDATEEISRLQAEIETERGDKAQAESKVAELELAVERLEQQPRQSRPGTPMRNGAVDAATPGRMGSPFAFFGSARKSGRPLTNTEYVARINELQQDLEAERRRTQKLSNAMDEMLAVAENRSPELLELRDEQQRLEEEVLSFSRLLEEANADRDNAKKEIERWEAEAESKAREADILRQQLRDLSAQIKILLVEMQLRDQGLEGMTSNERFQLEQAARGESEAWSENETTTNQLISQKLVVFRDVSQLQEQNQHLLQITRDLGERMEGEEARKKAAESEANALEIEELRQQVERYKDELQATATQIDSYVKERDMFRRMIQHRGHLPPDGDYEALFGRSVPPATPQRHAPDGIAETPRGREVEEMNKLLREQQTFFDQYRNESSQDRKVLKDQVDALGREKSNLQAEVAHWKSQKTLAEERLQMLQANFNGLRTENSEFQKRSQQMAENAAKQDLRTQQVAEELVEARSMVESLRNENANVKAEKELSKRIETRLTEDNRSLVDERSRLNKLVADLQSLQNERELTESENRRRMQTRVEDLENELADTKKKLEQEVEGARKATLRREFEEDESRKRIDDLVKSLGNVREELVAAKTTRDSLQARVDEMKIELRSAEERVAALQPRPTPRPQSIQSGEQQTNGDEDLPAEQRLALEVSELRRDLELAKNELESARQQVEQYRAISQATEEELASFNETSEQYKDEMDRQISEKDARVLELQQRVDDVLEELTTTNNELSELRTKHDESSRALDEQKAVFEGELTRLKDDAERHAEEKKLYQADLKAQAEIAQQAQQSYEDELLKHAEAAKSLQAVRKEYNDMRVSVAGIRAEADAAKAALENGEESWTEQRDKFEQELEEAKRRRQDVDEQNQLLHQQMESFSSELAVLRAGRAVPTGDGAEHASTPSGDANLQEVIKYLRREKEIVDVQYELSSQEARRLQQQLDYANTQLEETRQKLTEERRQSTDKITSEATTSKLMQTINELNLFRESSTTLRNEARQAREKLEEKSKEVERLFAEIEPLKGRVGELEGELEGKEGELQLLQTDRDHWRERTQNIISKYDRVDPAEIEEMKKRLEDLTAEKERLEAEQGPLREQVAGIDQKVEEAVLEKSKAYEEKIEKFRTQAMDRDRQQKAKIKTAEGATETANAEKASVEEQLAAVRTELEETKAALQAAQAELSDKQKESAVQGQVDVQAGSADTSAALRASLVQAEKNASDQSNRADTLAGEVQVLQARVGELESQASTLHQQLDQALQGEEGEISGTEPINAEILANLRQQLATAQQEVEVLRANTASTTTTIPAVSAAPDTGDKSVTEQVAQEVAKLRAELEAQHEVARKQLEEERDRRIETMKGNLRRQLAEERTKMKTSVREELAQEHSAELQKLKDEHAAAVQQLQEAHRAELDKLAQTGDAAIAKAEAPSSGVKAEQEWPTEEQMLEMMRTNIRVKGILNSNINKRVALETEKAHKAVAEKDQEIARLKEAQTAATDDTEKDELRSKLAAAEAEKTQAVQQALENEAKKVKVQLNSRDIALAKITVIKKAVQETPEKPVKEVWEVADKARPTPKPAATIATPSAALASSPVAAAAKPPVSPSPAQTQPNTDAPVSAMQELTEEDKIRLRQQKFGTQPPVATQSQPSAAAGTFGQPSAPVSGIRPPSASTFGQPSLAQPARRPSNVGPNPQAAAFTPGGEGGVGGLPQPIRRTSMLNMRGAFQQPRGGGATNPADPGISIQGAANAAQGQGTGSRGSGLPRGNAIRGARGGGLPRGAAQNAGQKRQHEGSDGGDNKRTRGGGAAGGAS